MKFENGIRLTVTLSVIALAAGVFLIMFSPIKKHNSDNPYETLDGYCPSKNTRLCASLIELKDEIEKLKNRKIRAST